MYDWVLNALLQLIFNSFKYQPNKMIKNTQTIRRLLPKNCLSVFDHFVGLALKELTLRLCVAECAERTDVVTIVHNLTIQMTGFYK